MTTSSAQQFTQDDVNVRLEVTASFHVTLGVYSGPITREMIAEAVREQIALLDDTDLARTFDAPKIAGIELDNGTSLIDGETA